MFTENYICPANGSDWTRTRTSAVRLGKACGQVMATDVVIMVDISEHSSLENKDFKGFLKNATLNLKISDYCDHVGLVAYDSKARVLAYLDKGVNDSVVEEIIEKIQPSKQAIANIGEAIRFTRTELFADTKINRKTQGLLQVAILVSHRSSGDNISEETALLQKDTKVFTVGVAQANVTQLSQIASQPTNRYQVNVKTFSDLSGQVDIIQKKILNAVHLVNFVQPEKTDHTKKGCLDTEQADIYLLIDGSGSIYPEDFTEMKTFLASFVDMFSIGPQKVRVGAVQYADRNQLEFSIATVYSKSDLKLALQNIRQLGGGTNTGAALNFTRELIVDPRNARGQNVPVYLIILTDGESQDSVKEAAEILRGDNVMVYAVGVKEANQTQLLEITGDEKRVHYVYNFAALKDIKDIIAQQICADKACEEPAADVMFLVDSSGSIGQENFNKMKTFMKSLVNQTKVGPNLIQFGVVQFSDTPMEVLQLNKNNDKETIWDSIDKMNYMAETTYTGEALRFVADYFTEGKGARPRVKKILILITDGEAHDEVSTPAASLRSSGVTINSVGVFNAVKSQLFEISGKMERVHYIETFDILNMIEDELIFGICSPEEECTRIEIADIVFVIDSSGSISDEQYNTMKDFMIAIVSKSDVGPTKVHFGALKYSDDPEKMFYLNQYSSKQDIIDAIRNDRKIDGTTYTAKALEYSMAFFTEKHGSRQRFDVPQYLIIITDGESHDQDKLGEASKALQDAGVILFSVGVDKAKTEELETMAGTKGKWFFVDNFDGLNDILESITVAVCNRTECIMEEADLVFLIDGSTSISPSDFDNMKEFIVSVVDDFDISPGRVHVGMAQYSDLYRLEFLPNNYTDKESIKDMITNISKLEGNTHIGKALSLTASEFFSQAANSRSKRGVPQILVVITDGESQDDVALPAQDLRSQGIATYAVGVGQVSETQLLQIAGSPWQRYAIANFTGLKNIKERVVTDICTPGPHDCFIDVVMAFDISTYPDGSNLFSGQDHLEEHLNDILKSITNVRSTSCGKGVKPGISVAFYLPNVETEVTPLFQIYSPDVAQNLKKSNVSGPLHLNSTTVKSMWEIFQNEDKEKTKMMLVFTDGLDENVEDLEDTVENLQKLGLSGLVTVALEGTEHYNELKYIEFGRGSDYEHQLYIGMPDIDFKLSKQMGPTGPRGAIGHAGEEGGEGKRGKPGSKGMPGERGFPGLKGRKGKRGLPGDKNEDGDPGVDGIPGEMGNAGKPGKTGDKGERGELGSSGIRGPPGDKGSPGTWGDMGDAGTPSTIPGSPGVKGEPGTEGETGQPGSPGAVGDDGRGLVMKGSNLQSLNRYRTLRVRALTALSVHVGPGRMLIGCTAVHSDTLEEYSQHLCQNSCQTGSDRTEQHILLIQSMFPCRPHTHLSNGSLWSSLNPIGRVVKMQLRMRDHGNAEEEHKGTLVSQGLKVKKVPKDLSMNFGENDMALTKHFLNSPQGDQGSQGDKGEEGNQGPKGLPGAFGGDGVIGNRGRPGAAGNKGQPGDNGENGDLGPDGQKGLMGDDGIPGFGAPGPQGEKRAEAPGMSQRPSRDSEGQENEGGQDTISGNGTKLEYEIELLLGISDSKGGSCDHGTALLYPASPTEEGQWNPSSTRTWHGITRILRLRAAMHNHSVSAGMANSAAIFFYSPIECRWRFLNRNLECRYKLVSLQVKQYRKKMKQSELKYKTRLQYIQYIQDCRHIPDAGAHTVHQHLPCEVINVIRNTCTCCQGKATCPVYPTELVFALDMAKGMTPAIHTKMIEIVTSLLSNIKIRESNCPVGARVAVVSYDKYTKYLLRFADSQSQEQLLEAVKNISLETSSNDRDIGGSMRFVARNIFKRSLSGATVRKIAVFFNNGPSDDVVSINTAVMEFNALGITPAVISFTPAPAIKQAFSMDDTGTFQLITIPANGDYKPLLQILETCTICFDQCKADPQCVAPSLPTTPVDMAFLLDSSYNMKQDDFEAAKGFISKMVDQLIVSNTGDRVAVVSNTPPDFRLNKDKSPHIQFELSKYEDSLFLTKHLQENCSHLQGPPAIGVTLQWALENIMPKASKSRKHKAIILILSGETSLWDKQVLSQASLDAKCKGYSLFVICIGQTYNYTELVDLASFPTDNHLLQLGRIHKPEFGYALGFVHSFLNSIRRSINKYPPPELKSKCNASGSTLKKRQILPNTYNPPIIALETRPETDLTLAFIKTRLIDEYQGGRACA
ncbi:collagen alpha-6(VI) chain-like [Gastrophryne carolinensis]